MKKFLLTLSLLVLWTPMVHAENSLSESMSAIYIQVTDLFAEYEHKFPSKEALCYRLGSIHPHLENVLQKMETLDDDTELVVSSVTVAMIQLVGMCDGPIVGSHPRNDDIYNFGRSFSMQQAFLNLDKVKNEIYLLDNLYWHKIRP